MDDGLFIFAGGGSGGHLYPGLATAEALKKKVPNTRVVFFVTERGIDEKIMRHRGWEFQTQPIMPIPRQIGKFWDFWKRWRASMTMCQNYLSQQQVAGVLGLGGFASGPMLRSAAKMGIPAAMLNPDMVPGKANRFSQHYAAKIFLQWPESRGFFGKNAAKCVVTGCPIRPDFSNINTDNSLCHKVLSELDLQPNRPILLVMGGSQGGRNVNDAFCESLRSDQELQALVSHWQICHLTGVDDEARMRENYACLKGLQISVRAFTDKMPELLASSSLVVGRSGASSLAEITAVGVGSILIPYPYHKDNHQMKNAEVLYQAGAALIVTDERDTVRTSKPLRENLKRCLRDETLRNRMAQAAKVIGKPDAADHAAQELLAMARKVR